MNTTAGALPTCGWALFWPETALRWGWCWQSSKLKQLLACHAQHLSHAPAACLPAAGSQGACFRGRAATVSAAASRTRSSPSCRLHALNPSSSSELEEFLAASSFTGAVRVGSSLVPTPSWNSRECWLGQVQGASMRPGRAVAVVLLLLLGDRARCPEGWGMGAQHCGNCWTSGVGMAHVTGGEAGAPAGRTPSSPRAGLLRQPAPTVHA
jgi:hypothetical protein